MTEISHTPLNVTPTQRANLQSLAFKLDTVDGQFFDMANFHSRNRHPQSSHTCGSTACAVGWGPAAGIAPQRNESWTDYAVRAFGVEPPWQYNNAPFWDWCFHHGWDERDNTPQGAAARIRYALDHGLPSNSGEQRVGLADLSYQEDA